MALINTLRNKMGKVVVIAIAISIAAFMAGDLLGPNSVLLGGTSTDVGEIAGVTITQQDLIAKIDDITNNYRASTGRNPSSAELVGIRNQAWDAMIADIAYNSQFDKLSIQVSDDELVDMVQGQNISPQIQGIPIFRNQQTNQFDKKLVVDYLKTLADQTPQQRAAWYQFEESLAPSRRRLKYENLILKTNYASQSEARQEYINTASTAEIKYLYVPFSSMEDSLVVLNEDELEDYLEAHEDEYQKEDIRKIEYVAFDVVPSASDTAMVVSEINELKQGFADSKNDSIFSVINSDGNLPFVTYKSDNIPEALYVDDALVEEGTVVGPSLDGNKYVLYKLAAISEGLQYSAKASHILFKGENSSPDAKTAAKAQARKILREIRNGASFAEMARIHGTDGTATRGGDLGWFTEGQMVAPFQEAVFNAKKKGLLSDVVETEFGYHIIDVTELKTNVEYKVAKVELEIYVSDQTRNKYYRDAELFSVDATDLKKFREEAKNQNITIKSAGNIGKNDRRIGSLSEARGIVSWLYNKADVGDVSEIYEIDNSYVLVAMTGKQEKGLAKLNDVRNEVEKKVKNSKLAEIIIAELQGKEGELEDIAEAYGSENAKIYSMPSLKLNNNFLTSVGIAPEAIGVIFSMEGGERTQPFALDDGVIIIDVINKIVPDDISDYNPYQGQIEQKRSSRLAFNIDATVKELAEIEDERYRFF